MLLRDAACRPRFALLAGFLAVSIVGGPVFGQATADDEEKPAPNPPAEQPRDEDAEEKADEEPEEKVESEAAEPRLSDRPLLSSEQRAALEEAIQERRRPPVPAPVAPPIDPGPDAYDEVGTAASAEMEAAGDLARDSGAAALLRSRAAINMQAAVEEYLQNQVNFVKAYHARREIWRDAQEEQRDPVTAEQAERIAEARSPKRLTQDHFNPETGEILWPPVLDSEPLASLRSAIERQFQRRSSPGYEWTTQNVRWVQANVDALQRAVDTAKADLPVDVYVEIGQLLDRIRWEAEFDGEGNRVQIAP